MLTIEELATTRFSRRFERPSSGSSLSTDTTVGTGEYLFMKGRTRVVCRALGASRGSTPKLNDAGAVVRE